MRNLMIAAVTLTLAGSLDAQAPNRAAVEKQIMANEQTINEAVAKRDLAAFQKLVARDGWSIDPSGVMAVTEFEKNINEVKVEPGWKIDSSKILWVNDNVAIHSYRWTGKGSFMGMPFKSPTYSSTTWANRGGTWLAVFH